MGVRTGRRRQLAVLLAGVLAAGCGSRTTASSDTRPRSTSEVETTIAAPASTTATSTTATATSTAPERPAAATRSTLAPVPGPLAFCDEPVLPVGPTEPPPSSDEVLRVEAMAGALQQLVDAHRDVLTGVWWDPATREIVVAGVDRGTTERLVAGVATQQTGYRIEVAAHSYAELDAVQQRVTPAAATAGVAYSRWRRSARSSSGPMVQTIASGRPR